MIIFVAIKFKFACKKIFVCKNGLKNHWYFGPWLKIERIVDVDE